MPQAASNLKSNHARAPEWGAAFDGCPPIAKRRAGFGEPPTPDLHRKHSPPLHHIKRVIALTDITRAIRENEIGLAKAELCPSPETDLDAAREPFASAL